jgi:hypothetical protein
VPCQGGTATRRLSGTADLGVNEWHSSAANTTRPGTWKVPGRVRDYTDLMPSVDGFGDGAGPVGLTGLDGHFMLARRVRWPPP